MNRFARSASAALCALALVLAAGGAQADSKHGHGRHGGHGKSGHGHWRGGHGHGGHGHGWHGGGWYPSYGHYVGALPWGYHSLWWGRSRYYYGSGVWYRPRASGFVVVGAPIGAVVPVLPPYYSTVWVGGAPYYAAGDVYYRWDAPARGYVVVEPPAAADVSEPSPVGDDLYVYPRQKQSQERQDNDRFECHIWAVDQTDYDPTEPLGGVDESQTVARRGDYQRANSACLEARGYSVK